MDWRWDRKVRNKTPPSLKIGNDFLWKGKKKRKSGFGLFTCFGLVLPNLSHGLIWSYQALGSVITLAFSTLAFFMSFMYLSLTGAHLDVKLIFLDLKRIIKEKHLAFNFSQLCISSWLLWCLDGALTISKWKGRKEKKNDLEPPKVGSWNLTTQGQGCQWVSNYSNIKVFDHEWMVVTRGIYFSIEKSYLYLNVYSIRKFFKFRFRIHVCFDSKDRIQNRLQ